MEENLPAVQGPLDGGVRSLVESLRLYALAWSGDENLGEAADDCATAADELERLHGLADSEGTRAVAYLRRARKAEAALLALADAADAVGVKHFDSDWLTDEVQAMQNATLAAREVLKRPNVRGNG